MYHALQCTWTIYDQVKNFVPPRQDRHVMDGSLPASLKHIISNAEYYGPSLFLLATDVVTAYVFQEPSLLSSLQVLATSVSH